MSSAYEIADELMTEVSNKYPHVKGNGLMALTLIRACDLLAREVVYSPESTDRLPGEPHGDEVRSEGYVPPPPVSRGRRDLAGTLSPDSAVLCPNCESPNLYVPDHSVKYLCTNCLYSEID